MGICIGILVLNYWEMGSFSGNICKLFLGKYELNLEFYSGEFGSFNNRYQDSFQQ